MAHVQGFSAEHEEWLVSRHSPVRADWRRGASFRHDAFATLVLVAANQRVSPDKFGLHLSAYRRHYDLPMFVFEHGKKHNVSYVAKMTRDTGVRPLLAKLRSNAYFNSARFSEFSKRLNEGAPLECYDHEADDRCPLCNSTEACEHLLAYFDETFAHVGEGEFSMGCIGGVIREAPEIEELFAALRREWVHSVRRSGTATAPSWITRDTALAGFFASLSQLGAFDATSPKTDDEAEEELAFHSLFLAAEARRALAEFLYPDTWCGLETTWVAEVLTLSTRYAAWWDPDASTRLPHLRQLIGSKLRPARSE
jgi:hypothetical protein